MEVRIPSPASVQAAMEVPVTASLGTMGPILRRLHSPVASDSEHSRLTRAEIQHIEQLCIGLKDASEAEDPSLMAKCWMKEVRELCYDTEDQLDEVTHSGARRRRTARLGIISSIHSKLKRRPQLIANDFSQLMARVKDAHEKRKRFHLAPNTMKPPPFVGQAGVRRLTPQRLQLLEVPTNNKLLVQLLAHDDNQKQLKVVPIFGPSGVGKTTLARTMYRQFGGKFQCRAFLRVSRNPDIRRLLTSVLSQTKAPPTHAFSDVQFLIDSVSEYLQDKRYLIIIDDLWTTSVWDIISRAFPGDGCYSRIITTTHIEDVALACCSYQAEYIFKMRPLNDDQSRKLLFNIIFGSEGLCPPDFLEVSHEIFMKCGGLPLATVNIASLLVSEQENLVMEKWKHIRDSLSSSTLETNPTSSEVMKEVLKLIYNNLPPHLKTCLLYLSMYPEGYTIGKDELVKQWVSEGFISAVKGQDIEDIAGGYFDDLVSRGMIQSVDSNYNGEVLSCTVHHMVLDLIRYKSMEENFITILNYFQTSLGFPLKVRRLSAQFGGAKSANVPETIRMSQVRSLLFCGFFKCVPSIADYVLLRVLVLHIWGDQEKGSFDLSRIGALFRLRYLKIVCNITVKLPAKIRAMQNLGTLEVNARLAAVPSDIDHLQSLLHLRLPSEANVPSISNLTNLRDLHLTCFTVPSEEHLVRYMKHLGSVLGKFSKLKSLVVDADGASRMSIPCDGLSSVSPAPAFLERLELLPLMICIFPRWIGELSKLCILKIAVRELSMEDICILQALPALAALSLYVQAAPAGRIVFGGGGFPFLRYFKFRCSVPWLKFEAGAMPNLHKLKLGFNPPTVDQRDSRLISIEHLPGLKEISAKVWGAAADAESLLTAAVKNDPRNPKINVQLVNYWNSYGDQATKWEVIHKSREQQGEIQEECPDECYPTLDNQGEENETNQADSRIPVLPESSSCLPFPAVVTEDAVVSASTGAMNSLLMKLTTLTGEGYPKLSGTPNSVMILKEELGPMTNLLKQLVDMTELNIAMKRLRNETREMTYDIEDCLDELIHRGCLEKWDAPQEFIQRIRNLKAQVGTTLGDLESSMHKTEVRTSVSSSYMATESQLNTVYRKAVELVSMKALKEKLNGVEQQRQVVCILGNGGAGKTRLAKELYNEIKQGRFVSRVFIPVPAQKIDITRLLENILSQLRPYSRTMKGDINEITTYLKDKRYLAVFDGVSSIQTLEYIKRALPENNLGSRIIMTTSTKDVADSCDRDPSSFIYQMKPLSSQDSLKLFQHTIFGSERSWPAKLGEAPVARKILEACEGIPLAIIIIAGLLASKPAEVGQWELVEKSMEPKGNDGLTTEEKIRRIFQISYSDLPHDMKSCFLYLSVFPENHVIRKDRLIWRWVAEGFIPRRAEESLWDTGESYFQQLITRNLIEQAPMEEEVDDQEVSVGCQVHGLVLKFITNLCVEENFVLHPNTAPAHNRGDAVIRRISLKDDDTLMTLSSMQLSKVRSLTCFVDARQMPGLSALRFVRVLDLESCGNLENHQLESIGELFLLRYLGLRGTGISELPAGIQRLRYMETIDLRRTEISEIPPCTVELPMLARLLFQGVKLLCEVESSCIQEISMITIDSVKCCQLVTALLNKSKQLRMLGIRFETPGCGSGSGSGYRRQELVSLLDEVAKSNKLRSLSIHDYPAELLDLALDSCVPRPPHHLQEFVLKISGRVPRVPDKMASLVNLTYLHINIDQVDAQGLSTLGGLPNLILLRLGSRHSPAPTRLSVSSDDFQCLKVLMFASENTAMALQFTPGSMPQLRRLQLEFNASKTDSCFSGDYDFGIQHLHCVRQVRATINCDGASVPTVEAVEAAIREQVSQIPNNPTVEFV